VIASILNRQWRRTAKGHRFEGSRVAHLRTYWKIPCFVPKADAADGELMTIKRAAIALGVAPSTIHRLNNDGIIACEQIKLGRDLAYPSRRNHPGQAEAGDERRCAPMAMRDAGPQPLALSGLARAAAPCWWRPMSRR
jgi:hypothetical protein